MADETAHRPAATPASRGRDGERGGAQSPLQARAAFLANWDWEFIIRLNQRACERGQAQHGINSETHATCRRVWEEVLPREITLAETLALLRRMHRCAPFLFFNGNTFAELGRQLSSALFADLAPIPLREVASATAHYIAGVLDEEALHQLIEQSAAMPTPKSP